MASSDRECYNGPMAKSVRSMSKRPLLPKVDSEMQRWSAELAAELAGWPRVTSRPMFGMTAFYRGDVIFAALPKTRAPETPFSLLVKVPAARSARLRPAKGPGAGWLTFEMQSEDDLPVALGWLQRAYEKARATKGH
jgi:hypothetical protein